MSCLPYIPLLRSLAQFVTSGSYKHLAPTELSLAVRRIHVNLCFGILCPVIRALLHLRVRSLHPALRATHFRKAERAIKLVSILGRQHPAAKALKLRMREGHINQPLAQTLPAKLLQHEHVCEPRKGGVIRNHPREPDLLVAFVETERERILD